MTAMRWVLTGACVWLAIGFAHVIYMTGSERRHLAAMKRRRQGYGDGGGYYSGMGLYTWFLVALVWPVLAYAVVDQFIEKRRK